MASCYMCGCSGASYRRTVQTGHSTGRYYSSRSSGSSSRTYYSTRMVCEDCAFDMDKGALYRSILGLWIFAIIIGMLVVHFKF